MQSVCVKGAASDVGEERIVSAGRNVIWRIRPAFRSLCAFVHDFLLSIDLVRQCGITIVLQSPLPKLKSGYQYGLMVTVIESRPHLSDQAIESSTNCFLVLT